MQFKRIRSNIDSTRSFAEVGTFTDENENLETTLKVHIDGKDEEEAEPKSALEDAADIQANLSNDQSTSSTHSELTVLPFIPMFIFLLHMYPQKHYPFYIFILIFTYLFRIHPKC